MEPILKVLKEYNTWKTNLRFVLDKNLNEIISLVVDVVGLNKLMPIEEVVVKSIYGGQQHHSYAQGTFPNFNNQVVKGIVINDIPNSAEQLIWFYSRGNYYLINHEKNTSLNLQPYIDNGTVAAPFAIRPTVFTANFDVQIEFLLAFVEWLPALAEILKGRIDRIDPKRVESEIKEFAKAVK